MGYKTDDTGRKSVTDLNRHEWEKMDDGLKYYMDYKDTGPICLHCRYYSNNTNLTVTDQCTLNPACSFPVKNVGGCKKFAQYKKSN